MTTNLFEDADIISSYSRRQAIEDGVLVDLMQAPIREGMRPELDDWGAMVREAGFVVPLAMTAAAFAKTIGEPDKLPAGQDLKGRLWDVLWMLKLGIKGPGRDRVDFKVSVLQDKGRREVVELYALIHPGDAGEPVITIMLQGED